MGLFCRICARRLRGIDPIALQRGDHRDGGAGQPGGLVEVLPPPCGLDARLVGLVVALDDRMVGGEQLRRHDAFKLVPRRDPGERAGGVRHAGVVRLRLRGIGERHRARELIGEAADHLVGWRRAAAPRSALIVVALATRHRGVHGSALLFRIHDRFLSRAGDSRPRFSQSHCAPQFRGRAM
jgi:hypothetical protein